MGFHVDDERFFGSGDFGERFFLFHAFFRFLFFSGVALILALLYKGISKAGYAFFDVFDAFYRGTHVFHHFDGLFVRFFNVFYIFFLHAIKGLTFEQIGKQLGKKLDTCAHSFYDARRNLKKHKADIKNNHAPWLNT